MIPTCSYLSESSARWPLKRLFSAHSVCFCPDQVPHATVGGLTSVCLVQSSPPAFIRDGETPLVLTHEAKPQGRTTKSRNKSPAFVQCPALEIIFEERKTANLRDLGCFLTSNQLNLNRKYIFESGLEPRPSNSFLLTQELPPQERNHAEFPLVLGFSLVRT